MSVLTDNTAKLRKILEKVENLPEMPPSVAQATPTISVSSGGLITATATQEAGTVAAGTKSATRQLSTKGGTTITPGTSEQTAVSAGTYVTGDIKVAAAAGGKQVATGTVTLRGSAENLSFSPGFNPAYVLISMVAKGSGDGSSGTVRGWAAQILLKNGTWTAILNNDGEKRVVKEASYSGGTLTLSIRYSFGTSANFTSGSYEWIATS